MKFDRFLKYEVGDDFFFDFVIAAGVPISLFNISVCARISYVTRYAFCRRIEISVVRIFALTDSIGQGFALLDEWPPGRQLNHELVDTNSRLVESSYFSSGEPFNV
jgi:hypothetical protein